MSKIQSFFETSRNYIISVGNNHHNSVPDAAKHELDITLALAEEIVLGNKFQRINRKPPTSMQLEKSGFTYVGVNNKTINRFDSEGNQTQNSYSADRNRGQSKMHCIFKPSLLTASFNAQHRRPPTLCKH